MKKPVLSIFISHRHDDSKIAEALARTFEDWTQGEAEIGRSSDARYAFSPGEPLKDELIEGITRNDLFLLVYTVADVDWSYVMFEAGMASSRVETRLVVFQFGDKVPAQLEHIIHVPYTEDGIRTFTDQFHHDPGFFPRLDGALAPNLSVNNTEKRAERLWRDLQLISPTPSWMQQRMRQQYGEIHAHFEHLEGVATEKLLMESPYDRNVFVMLPFRHEVDDRYEAIVSTLNDEFRKRGYHTWLAADKTVFPQLWDNVVSFLIACKYAVAVFTRVEKEQRIVIDDFNPNVSLELGFFLSRGKKVLLLKDKALLKLPTDLVGHLYEEFDLNRVSRQLPAIISSWVRQIEV